MLLYRPTGLRELKLVADTASKRAAYTDETKSKNL